MCPILDVVCGFLAAQLTVQEATFGFEVVPLSVLLGSNTAFFPAKCSHISPFSLTCEGLLTLVSVGPDAVTK